MKYYLRIYYALGHLVDVSLSHDQFELIRASPILDGDFDLSKGEDIEGEFITVKIYLDAATEEDANAIVNDLLST